MPLPKNISKIFFNGFLIEKVKKASALVNCALNNQSIIKIGKPINKKITTTPEIIQAVR